MTLPHAGRTALVTGAAAGLGQACAIAPSLVRTPGASTGFHDETGMFDLIAGMQAIKRTQMANDLASVVAFRCSEEGGFITGRTLVVDGGLVRS